MVLCGITGRKFFTFALCGQALCYRQTFENESKQLHIAYFPKTLSLNEIPIYLKKRINFFYSHCAVTGRTARTANILGKYGLMFILICNAMHIAKYEIGSCIKTLSHLCQKIGAYCRWVIMCMYPQSFFQKLYSLVWNYL